MCYKCVIIPVKSRVYYNTNIVKKFNIYNTLYNTPIKKGVI